MLKKIALVIFCSGLFLTAVGCNTPNAANKTGPDPAREQIASGIMNEFQSVVQKNASVEEVAGFINNNIMDVSPEDGSKMVDEFERLQKDYLPQLENIFFTWDIQDKINSEYNSITDQSEIKDTGLRELITGIRNNGYRVETAEGMYFPIIDYEFYKKFKAHVTADRQDYIDIMAVESSNVPAKDAALVIGWDEVVKRALNQERFINTHTKSVKINEIKQLQQKYVTFTLYGCNNTPLFSYDTETFNPQAREVYLNTVANSNNSEFIKDLEGFLDVAAKNDYKLTSEVNQYRTSVSKKYSE